MYNSYTCKKSKRIFNTGVSLVPVYTCPEFISIACTSLASRAWPVIHVYKLYEYSIHVYYKCTNIQYILYTIHVYY